MTIFIMMILEKQLDINIILKTLLLYCMLEDLMSKKIIVF